MMVGYRVEGMACRFLEKDYNFWQEGCCCSYRMVDRSLNLAVDCTTEVGRSFDLVQACMIRTEMVEVVRKGVWNKGCSWQHSYYHIVA